jgi:hypothetical protein
MKVSEPPDQIREKVPLADCAKRVDRVWEILKCGVLDPDRYKDAWLINTAEAVKSKGQFGNIMHPKWRPAADTYFYHDTEIDALIVLDRAPETLAANKGNATILGIKKGEVCCCDAIEHAKKFKMPVLNRGDCRNNPLPIFEGSVVTK